MRPGLLLSASALAFCVATSAFAAQDLLWPHGAKLYNQNNDDFGQAVLSENYTDGDFTTYDSYGADDFAIPRGHTWKIDEVDVTGVFANGSGPATSENVYFYSDDNGLPGSLISECDNIVGAASGGNFAIKIPQTCKTRLKGGKSYWLSVAPNMDILCCGEWDWETRTVQRGNPAVWENPTNSFGTGCETWNPLRECLGSNVGMDFMFELKGRDRSK
jgi:hypothetical protein